MNTLDFFILFPIIIGSVFGLFKGFIKELTSLVAIFLGIYIARLFAQDVSKILIETFHYSQKIALPMAYVLLFVLIVLCLFVAAGFLDRIFSTLALGSVNKLLGGFLGGLKYALIISVLLNVVNAVDEKFNVISLETKENSFAFKPILRFAPVLWYETKKSTFINLDVKDQNEQSN